MCYTGSMSHSLNESLSQHQSKSMFKCLSLAALSTALTLLFGVLTIVAVLSVVIFGTVGAMGWGALVFVLATTASFVWMVRSWGALRREWRVTH